jgi:hypothetical protein
VPIQSSAVSAISIFISKFQVHVTGASFVSGDQSIDSARAGKPALIPEWSVTQDVNLTEGGHFD